MRHFYVLAWFPFITSELELYYYHQKLNVRVASRVCRIKQHLGFSEMSKFLENFKTKRRQSVVLSFFSENKNLAIAKVH